MNSSVRSVGLIGATSMVVGSMIGSGILIISSKISLFGGFGLLAWALSSFCAISLAFSFSVMSRKFSKPGIPYYVYKAFNSHFLGFHTSWAHWLGMVIGCCTVSIAFSDYLFFMLPDNVAFLKPIASIAIIWALTLMSIRSSIFSVGLITLITFLKVGILLLLVGSSIKYFSFAKLCISSQAKDISGNSISGIASILQAMPLALFAFLGLESATASGDSVKNPEKTLPIATLLGTLIASFVFIAIHISVMSVLPIEAQIASKTPVADVANYTMGSFAVILTSFMACFGLIGSINGLVFVSSYILFSASKMGWISEKMQFLSKKSKFPAVSGLCSALLITVAILAYNFGVIDMRMLVYIDAFLLIFVYLLGSIAYKIHGGNYFISFINLAACLVLMYGCGLIAALSAMFLVSIGSIIFYFRKHSFNNIS
ncbi:amino acid permease [Candidatus Cytomitobacter indipagum]|uniref:Amino acid permease n=1 Tax=Candidatus Cytomitobacter indipagum TaxID=2601575 RepID=A0A5C0UEN9_9PROT|nr:amino acid permease [Candidatus Cytomitobacter indipagum]QEK38187.1 amino acid permease [Candidatus Cytomitobacter indipagum]